MSISFNVKLVYSVHSRHNVVTVKVRSHQARMKRYARMIYMLSQSKDAIDNPAALFAQMRRREWRELGGTNLAFGAFDA